MSRDHRVDDQDRRPGSADGTLESLRGVLAARDRQLDVALRAVGESESRFRNVWSAIPVGLALADERGQFVTVNDALCRLLGRDAADIVSATIFSFVHPDDALEHNQARQLVQGAPPAGAHPDTYVERRYVRPSGEVRWARLTVTPVPGPAGEPWALACFDDVTDRRRAAQTLRDSERDLSAMARVTRRIQAGGDARGTIVEAARTMVSAQVALLMEPIDDKTLVVTACSGASLEGINVKLKADSAVSQVFRSGQPLFLADPVESLLVTCTPTDSEFGSMRWQPVFRDGGCVAVIVVRWHYRIDRVPERCERALVLLAEETSLALSQDERHAALRLLARTDALTALPNRRAWDDQLAAVAEVAHVTGEPLVVALVDLDHFKRFNDRHGHTAGDDHLREFALRARATIRESDLLVRWGGEEFSMALPNCLPQAALTSLTRVLHAVPGSETCSIGWATWDGVETVQDLLTRVDQALYDAKAAGRNRILSADDPGTATPG